MSEKLYTTHDIARSVGISRPGIISRARKLNIFPRQVFGSDERAQRRKMFRWTEEQRLAIIANKVAGKKSPAKGGAWDRPLCSDQQPCIWCKIKDEGNCGMGVESTCYKLHMNLYIKGVRV